MPKFRLKEHNTKEQMNFGDCSDTRKYLEVGKVYDGIKEVHSWHTKIIINGVAFNSVCFEEVGKSIREALEDLFDTAAQNYPYWNYIDKPCQIEIDRALAEIEEMVVPSVESIKQIIVDKFMAEIILMPRYSDKDRIMQEQAETKIKVIAGVASTTIHAMLKERLR